MVRDCAQLHDDEHRALEKVQHHTTLRGRQVGFDARPHAGQHRKHKIERLGGHAALYQAMRALVTLNVHRGAQANERRGTHAGP